MSDRKHRFRPGALRCERCDIARELLAKRPELIRRCIPGRAIVRRRFAALKVSMGPHLRDEYLWALARLQPGRMGRLLERRAKRESATAHEQYGWIRS